MQPGLPVTPLMMAATLLQLPVAATPEPGRLPAPPVEFGDELGLAFPLSPEHDVAVFLRAVALESVSRWALEEGAPVQFVGAWPWADTRGADHVLLAGVRELDEPHVALGPQTLPHDAAGPGAIVSR